MNKPFLIVVTGSIASGKTTLGRVLANTIKCPLISRDELHEGLLNTLNTAHTQLNSSVDLDIYNIFFETIETLNFKGISLVVEAAFQHKLWKPKLLNLLDKTEMRIVICKTHFDLIKSRFANRFSNDSDREKYHGDSAQQFFTLTENYKTCRC